MTNYEKDIAICEAAPGEVWEYDNGVLWHIVCDQFGEPEQEPLADTIDVLGEYFKKFNPAYVRELIEAKKERDELKSMLPQTADGTTVMIGMTVYCVVGKFVDEREIISIHKKAVSTYEPARHGACAGQSYRKVNTIYASRDNALIAAKELLKDE